MLSNKNVIRCNRWSFPDVVRAWVQRASVNNVRCLRKKCSLLFLCKGLILACSIETLSNGLDESFHDSILMACVGYIPLPFEITGEFLA